MHLLSINVGKERAVSFGKKGITGIYKLPMCTPVAITRDGLEGDAVCDTKNHGGPDQAVYVYGTTDYDWWSKELDQDLAPGTFGENLTVADLETAPLHIGDRLRVGAVLLEVTAPRAPCVVLAGRMGDPMFVKRFRQAERPGVYCRVIDSGTVSAGDPVSLEPYRGETLTVLEDFRLYYDSEADEAAIRRALAAPIDIRGRGEYEERLAALLAKA